MNFNPNLTHTHTQLNYEQHQVAGFYYFSLSSTSESYHYITLSSVLRGLLDEERKHLDIHIYSLAQLVIAWHGEHDKERNKKLEIFYLR